MAIDVRDLATRTLEPVISEELDIFERTVADYFDGRVDEDTFRVFRLNHGVYGQRQGGTNQMLRVKVPHGRVTPEQLDTFAYIAETYSSHRGRRRPPTSCCATPTRSACPASSRSTSPAAKPTAARRCSTTSVSSHRPAHSTTAPSNRDSACSSRAA
jgi:hypothetical protein